MKPMHRHIHFDFHTMPGIYDFNRDWDAAAFAQRLADAKVDYVNIFAQCNLGFAYYPTKLGIPYPGMKGDMFGDALRECHQRGIGVTAYINIGLMHEHQRRHPEWCRYDREGRLYRGDPENDNFFRTLCYNSPGYRNFLLGIVREISAYDIDGLFCDCMQWFPCYCNYCVEGMKHEGIDLDNEQAVLDYDRRVVKDLSARIKEIVGPDRYTYFNGMPYYDYRHLQTHVELECLPSAWGYDYFWHHVAYARNIQDTVLYMTGRFQKSWGDFGGYRTKASIENDLYDGLCNNALPSVGDHIHPAEIQEEGIFNDIGEIYTRIEQYEPYMKGARFCSDIGVLTDVDGFGFQHVEYAGLARMLGELKQSYDIIHVDMDFDRFPLLILPDRLTVGQVLSGKLKAYLDGGGKILSTGFGGLKPDLSGFALEEYGHIMDFQGKDDCNSAYFTFRTLPEGTVDRRWSMYKEAVLIRARQKEDERAAYVKPYFNKHWDGQHGYFYTPPEKPTGQSAAICRGGIAHICFCVFNAYYDCALREHKRLVGQLIDELLPEPLIRVQRGIPSTARVTMTGTNRHRLLHVKVTRPEPRGALNIVEEHDILPAGAAVSVRGRYERARVLPDGEPVSLLYEDDRTVLTLPQIIGYDMILLE